MLEPVKALTEEEIKTDNVEVAAEIELIRRGKVSKACLLAIDLELFLAERVEKLGKAGPVVARLATMRVAARTAARRYEEPSSSIEHFRQEFHVARSFR